MKNIQTLPWRTALTSELSLLNIFDGSHNLPNFLAQPSRSSLIYHQLHLLSFFPRHQGFPPYPPYQQSMLSCLLKNLLSVPSGQDALPIAIISAWCCHLLFKVQLNVLLPSVVPAHRAHFWLWIHLSPCCVLSDGSHVSFTFNPRLQA